MTRTLSSGGVVGAGVGVDVAVGLGDGFSVGVLVCESVDCDVVSNKPALSNTNPILLAVEISEVIRPFLRKKDFKLWGSLLNMM